MSPLHRMAVLIVALLALSACAKKNDESLPGAGVSRDGGVHLTPPKPSVPGAARGGDDGPGSIEAQLFQADLVMENQSAIGLEPAQRETIDKEIKDAQNELVDLQWKLQSEKEALVKVLSSEVVDEKQSRETAERVMAEENKVKAAHLAMLVRIKNVLTPAQQAKLREIRDNDRCAPAAPSASGGR
jgi:uncharacterized membrane protein